MNTQCSLNKVMLAASLMSFGVTSAFAATTYQVTPIYSYGSVSAINASGMLIGEEAEAALYYNANNQPVFLSANPSGFIGAAYDINASSQIIYDDLDSAYLWQNGVSTPLSMAPFSINDAGQISGNDGSGAVIYHNGNVTQLPGSGYSVGYAINNLGHVAGASVGSAALWVDGTRIDLGRLPGASDAYAYGINENDQVVGSSGGRAFLWQDGVMLELPTIVGAIHTEASRINKHGEIVGYARIAGPVVNSSQWRFLYWKNGVVSDLTLLVQNGGQATGADINDNGQIAANGWGSFRLTPTVPGADVGVGIYSTTLPTQYGRINLGQQVTYKIEVGNTGSFDASNVVVSDVFPSNMTFISATPSKGTCSFNGTLACSMGNFAPGTRESIEVTLLPTVAGTFTSNVSVSMNESDVNSANNTSYVGVNVADISADVSLTMSGPSSVKRNSNVTYTINVHSGGLFDANNVRLTDTLPSGMRFVSVTTDRGTCSGTSTITCDLGNMSVGIYAKVTVKAVATTRGTFTNQATVTSTTKDPNTGNNTASIKTSVN